MECFPTRIHDVLLIRPRMFADDRGYFFEASQQRKLADFGINAMFVQDNLSRSVRGVLRGLHYQVRQPQGKLVSVVRGAVFDVAVDLRRRSGTFGQWVGEILSDENHHLMWIPPGFAHGFMVISEAADFFYKCTDYYAPADQRTIQWNDPTLAIEWPTRGSPPIVSPKDTAGASLRAADLFP
jgi:dTDP-4-dehydrorhamnose 3,5-epimerase